MVNWCAWRMTCSLAPRPSPRWISALWYALRSYPVVKHHLLVCAFWMANYACLNNAPPYWLIFVPMLGMFALYSVAYTTDTGRII